jgi:hypothetical protein
LEKDGEVFAKDTRGQMGFSLIAGTPSRKLFSVVVVVVVFLVF